MPTARELRELALQSAQKDYERVIAELTIVAKEGKFSKTFPGISDGARQLLMNAGYKVDNGGISATGLQYYRVSF